MATPSEGISGLNLYNQDPAAIQEYRDVLKEAEAALKARYENPNWFNVAAGFLKPQLGGFAASLGSAGAALGDWQEKQRANEVPLAQMRAENARAGLVLNSKMGLAKNAEEAAKLFTPGSPEEIEAKRLGYTGGSGVAGGQAAISKIQEQWSAENTANELQLQQALKRGDKDAVKYLEGRQAELLRRKPANMGVLPAPANATIPSAVVPPTDAAAPEVSTIDVRTGRDKTGKIPMALPPLVGNLSETTRNAATQQATALEAAAQDRLKELNLAMSYKSYTPVNHALEVLSTVPVNVLDRISDQLRSYGGLATILQSGVNIGGTANTSGTGGAGANVTGRVDVLAALRAKLTPSDRTWLDTVVHNAAIVNKARGEGRIPGSYTPVGDLENTADAFRNSFRKDSVLLNSAAVLHKKMKEMLPHKNEMDLAPTHSLFESVPVALIERAKAQALANEHATFKDVVRERSKLEELANKKP